MTVDPKGFRRFLVNPEPLLSDMLDRIGREARAEGSGDLLALHAELCELAGPLPEPDLDRPMPLLIPITLEKDGMRLSMFSTLTTMGTPLDVTLSELRIESYYPADEASRAFAAMLTASLGG